MENLKNIQLSNEEIKRIFMNSYYQKSIEKIENSNVSINHLENVFSDEKYYLAMKTVPLLERKVLYLFYIENIRLNDICKRLKLQKYEVISLRNKAIIHFKNNLELVCKMEKLKKGGKK